VKIRSLERIERKVMGKLR